MTGKRIASLLAFLWLVSADLGFAAGKVTYGAGLVSCGEWQQYRSRNDKTAVLQLEAWLAGFLSGYNVASDDHDYLAPKPQSVAYSAWLDNYCARNPLNPVAQAAFALKEELLSRARP